MSNNLGWADTLITAFVNRGVRHAILSPGSRSTPIVIAAARHKVLKKQVILDERSAAFAALGIGKATGRPALLICTSGTAVTNYHPAVTEARESGVPMVVLSADRPPNLRNLGSSQTTDQIKVFGGHAVFFHEAGEPRTGKDDLKRLRYLASQAVDFAIERGGAAHINLPFRKPLEPSAKELGSLYHDTDLFSGSDGPSPSIRSRSLQLGESLYKRFSKSRKPLIIAGPANPHHSLTEQIREFADHLDAPVIAEAGSGMPIFDKSVIGFDRFLRNKNLRKKLRPDMILRFGDQPYSKPMLLALEEWSDIPLCHFSARRAPQDQAMSRDRFIHCLPGDYPDLEPVRRKELTVWREVWEKLDHASEKHLDKALSKTETLTDGHVFRHVSNHLPDGWNVMLSNSLPVRDILTFGTSLPYQFVNRGTAGIDGICSTAIGLHLSTERPTLCMIGDLALLHDSNALYTLGSLKTGRPFVCIILNNRGGNIFRMLPVYSHPDRALPEDLYRDFFETPQNVNIGHLAKASDIPYQKVEGTEALRKIDLSGIEGPLIVECITSADKSMNLRKALWNHTYENYY